MSWDDFVSRNKKSSRFNFGPSSNAEKLVQAQKVARQQQEEKKRVVYDYRDRFFKESKTSQAVDGITGSLLMAAQRGDRIAAERYMAITEDERMKPFRQSATPYQPAGKKAPQDNPFTKMSGVKVQTTGKGTGPLAPTFKQVLPEGPKLNIAEQGATATKGLYDAMVQAPTRSYQGVNVGVQQGAIRREVDGIGRIMDTNYKTIQDFRARLKSPSVTEERKVQLQKGIDELFIENAKLKESQNEIVARYSNAIDNKKNIAAGAELGLELATAGTYRLANTALKGASRASKIAVKTPMGAITGAGFGATSAIQSGGDVGEGVKTGAMFGAGLGAGSELVGAIVKGARSPGTPVVNSKGKTVNSNPLRRIPNPIRAAESQVAPAFRKVLHPLRGVIDKKAPVVGKAIDFAGGLIDKTNALKKPYRGLKDLEGDDIPRKIEDKVTDARNAVSTGSTQFRANKYVNQLVDIFESAGKTNKGKRNSYTELSEFIGKKQDAINKNKIAKKTVIEVPVGTPLQEKAYKITVKAYKEPVRELYRAGMIDKATYQKWMKDDNYVRVQRNIDDLLDKQLAPKESERLNKSKNVAEEKLQNSDREVQDIFATMEEYYQKAYTSSTRRELAKYLKDVGQQHGIIKEPLVSATRVKNRIELWEELKESRGVKKKLLKSLKTKGRQFRKLETEFNRLNKEGLNKALKENGKEKMPDFVPEGMGGKTATSQTGKGTKTKFVGTSSGTQKEPSKQITRLSKQRDELVNESTKLKRPQAEVKYTRGKVELETIKKELKESGFTDKQITKILKDTPTIAVNGKKGVFYAPSSRLARNIKRARDDIKFTNKYKAIELDAKAKEIQVQINKIQKLEAKAMDARTLPSKISESDTRKFINSLVGKDSKEYNIIKKKILNREPKLKDAFEEIDNLRNDVDVHTELNKKLYQAIKDNKDQSTVNTNTLKVWQNGVRELYEIDPETFRQLNNVSEVQINGLVKASMYASRVLRSGATAANPAFAAVNIVRDQLGSFINSEDIFATHNPLSLARGLTEAIAKPTARATVGKFIKKGSFFDNMLQPSKEYKMWAKNNSNITYIDMARNAQNSTKATQKMLGIRHDDPLTAFENMIAASEKATRYQNWIGTYKKELAKKTNMGKARDLADRASRGNSVNFSNSSEIAHWSKIFNPYLNAGIQGSRQLAMSFRDRPISTALKVTATVITPVMAATYYNLSDPKRAEMYGRMMSDKPYELENNLVFIHGDGTYTKVPLPPGVNKFANPFRNYVESQYIGDRQGFHTSAYQTLVEPFNPLGDTWLQILGNTSVPQWSKPLIEAEFNKKFLSGEAVIDEDTKKLGITK